MWKFWFTEERRMAFGTIKVTKVHIQYNDGVNTLGPRSEGLTGVGNVDLPIDLGAVGIAVADCKGLEPFDGSNRARTTDPIDRKGCSPGTANISCASGSVFLEIDLRRNWTSNTSSLRLAQPRPTVLSVK